MDTVIKELINKRIETANLDYKAGFEWAKKNRDHQFELIRDILAMANTRDGGTIILGVKDDTRELAGVSKEVWNSFDQSAIGEMVHRYSKPKVGLQVIKTQVESKLVVALTIAEFEDVPIICTETITALNTTRPIVGVDYPGGRRPPELYAYPKPSRSIRLLFMGWNPPKPFGGFWSLETEDNLRSNIHEIFTKLLLIQTQQPDGTFLNEFLSKGYFFVHAVKCWSQAKYPGLWQERK
jgi:hypothetical protein